MTEFVIKENAHWAKPFQVGIYYNKRKFNWEIKFDSSAIYNIGTDQDDVNKLCGVRYLFGDNSARFGWRYNPAFPDKIQILAYVHDAGKVTAEMPITEINFNEQTWFHLSIEDKVYHFFCKGKSVSVEKTHTHKIGFAQNVYFGGTQTAPHDIKIFINKV